MDNELQIVAIQSREPLDALKVRLTKDGGLARIREQIKTGKNCTAFCTNACPHNGRQASGTVSENDLENKAHYSTNKLKAKSWRLGAE